MSSLDSSRAMEPRRHFKEVVHMMVDFDGKNELLVR
jgi:hypothetical protein